MSISDLSANDNLDRFIQTEVQAPSTFVESANKAIDQVVRVLHGPQFTYQVDEVFKTGSLGQGIALNKNLSDIDLVVYLNHYSVEEITKDMKELLNNMDASLKRANLSGYKRTTKQKDRFRLGVQLKAGGQTFDVDLLPGMKGEPKVLYDEMLASNDPQIREHYSVSFAKQQRDFIKQRETKLKSLFQLAKYWTKVDLGIKVPSYLINLIVIHTWEKQGQPENFKTEEMFKAFLQTLVNYKDIHKVWFDNYDQATWQKLKKIKNKKKNKSGKCRRKCGGGGAGGGGGAAAALAAATAEAADGGAVGGKPAPSLLPKRKKKKQPQNKGPKPFLFDPANPANNLMKGQNWGAIAKAAKETLDSPIMAGVSSD